MKRINSIYRFKIIILSILLICATVLAACSSPKESPLDKYPASDMSGYPCFSDYDGEFPFVDMTVKDVEAEMENKSSFVLYLGFDDCPWCNAMLPYFNEAALAEGCKVGYIDTRRNPEWQSNLDLEDYDIFVELFGEYLQLDDAGLEHLYVPHVFFIKNGKVVFEKQGTVPGQAAASDTLTKEQEEEIMKIYKDGFSSMK